MNVQEEKLKPQKTGYVKPSTEVVGLEMEAAILNGSGGDKSASFGGKLTESYNGGQGNHLNVTRR